MRERKRRWGSDFAKLDATTDEEIARHMVEDDTPELTEEQLAEAEIYVGNKFVRRAGRPKGSGKKELVTLRLDREMLEHFRAGGPGWQTRVNDTLRGVSVTPKPHRRAAPRLPEAQMLQAILERVGSAGSISAGQVRKLAEKYTFRFGPGARLRVSPGRTSRTKSNG